MRDDDEIALEIGRAMVKWMRHPQGRSGTLRVMGDGVWPHGYDVTVAFAPPRKCLNRTCDECR